MWKTSTPIRLLETPRTAVTLPHGSFLTLSSRTYACRPLGRAPTSRLTRRSCLRRESRLRGLALAAGTLVMSLKGIIRRRSRCMTLSVTPCVAATVHVLSDRTLR